MFMDRLQDDYIYPGCYTCASHSGEGLHIFKQASHGITCILIFCRVDVGTAKKEQSEGGSKK